MNNSCVKEDTNGSYECTVDIFNKPYLLTIHLIFQEFGYHHLTPQPIPLSTLCSCPVTGSVCIKPSAHVQQEGGEDE